MHNPPAFVLERGEEVELRFERVEKARDEVEQHAQRRALGDEKRFVGGDGGGVSQTGGVARR